MYRVRRTEWNKINFGRQQGEFVGDFNEAELYTLGRWPQKGAKGLGKRKGSNGSVKSARKV